MTTEANAGDAVHDLVRQREQLRAWIAKLDEVGTGAPSRVTERVRADYQDRLRRVTEELSAHGGEVERALEQLRADLSAAEERRAHAEDALEEQRLRSLIGELDADAWERVSAPLESEVRAAEEAVARARDEVDRLAALLREIGGGDEPEDEPAPDAAGGARPPAETDQADREDRGAPTDQGEEIDEIDASWDAAIVTVDDDLSAPPSSGHADEEEQPAAAPFEYAPEDEEPEPAADAGFSSPSAEPVSGEELAAWISEVEAEAGTGEEPQREPEPPAAAPQADASAADDADGWDPFANEFGGSPAAPTTQPGDATQDLPWLDSIEGGAAGKWSAPQHADDLAFLDHLDEAPPAAEPPAPADLHEDDLAFLEELDRAISGGAPRAAQNGSPSPPAASPLDGGFTGGSGEGGGFITPAGGGERKRGEALLCKECGAINEPQAWYCEICGSEL